MIIDFYKAWNKCEKILAGFLFLGVIGFVLVIIFKKIQTKFKKAWRIKYLQIKVLKKIFDVALFGVDMYKPKQLLFADNAVGFTQYCC